MLEKTFESPLDCKEIQPVHPKGDQSWVFIGMTDVEAETPILWPPNAKSCLIWKAPDAGKDWMQEEKGTTEGMASPTQWTWVWVDSGSLWWTGRPGVLRLMGSQKGGPDWATELNWAEPTPVFWHGVSKSPTWLTFTPILLKRVNLKNVSCTQLLPHQALTHHLHLSNKKHHYKKLEY